MSGNDFDWETDADVVVRNQDSIAIFINVRGEIAIKQQNWPEDDSLILFRPEHAEAVARAILKTAGITLDEFTESVPRVIPLGETPSTGAARQRRYRERHQRNGSGVTRRDANGNAQPETLLLT